MPIQWDEANHFDNGLFLKLGTFTVFSKNLFYPPLYDVLTFLSYSIFGVSVVSARIVDAFFSVLLLWVVFEFANKAYGGKTALLASVFLGIMPGYFASSHVAMIDIPMTFFFALSIFLFYLWLQNESNKMLVLAGTALILGFFTKYQAIVALIVIFIAALVLCRNRVRRLFSKKYIAILAVTSAIIAGLIVNFFSYISMWLNVIGMNTTSDQTIQPAFYLIETQSIYSTIHPISLSLYILGFAGLALFIIRRGKPDKIFLVWFITVFIFYTLIANKNWRYVIPFYPVLAIAAAVFITITYTKLRERKKTWAKIGAFLLIVFTVFAFFQSFSDNIAWVNWENTSYPLEQAVNYAMAHNVSNQSFMVLCPNNVFSPHIMKFYLLKNGGYQIDVFRYPNAITIDTTFNITTLISRCMQNNVKFVFISEYLGNYVSYFNSTLTLMDVYTQLFDSGNFTQITPEQTFGQTPNSIHILNFTGGS